MFRYRYLILYLSHAVFEHVSISEMSEIKKLVLPYIYLSYFYAFKTDFIGRLGNFRQGTVIQ